MRGPSRWAGFVGVWQGRRADRTEGYLGRPASNAAFSAARRSAWMGSTAQAASRKAMPISPKTTRRPTSGPRASMTRL